MTGQAYRLLKKKGREVLVLWDRAQTARLTVNKFQEMYIQVWLGE